jgi:hypothetical protein
VPLRHLATLHVLSPAVVEAISRARSAELARSFDDISPETDLLLDIATLVVEHGFYSTRSRSIDQMLISSAEGIVSRFKLSVSQPTPSWTWWTKERRSLLLELYDRGCAALDSQLPLSRSIRLNIRKEAISSFCQVESYPLQAKHNSPTTIDDLVQQPGQSTHDFHNAQKDFKAEAAKQIDRYLRNLLDERLKSDEQFKFVQRLFPDLLGD